MSSLKYRRLLAILILAALLPLGVGCGSTPDPNGPGSYQAIVQAQQSSQEKLKSRGGRLERKEYPQGAAWAVDVAGQEINDELLANLKGLDRISELNLSGTNLSDDHIAKLNEVTTATINLNLSNSKITDGGLANLEAKILRTLDVSGTAVSSAGVTAFLKKREANEKILPLFKNVSIKRS